MSLSAEAMALDSLRRLNRSTIESAVEVRAVLERAALGRIPLSSGIDGRINRRTAVVERVLADRVVLSVENVDVTRLPQLYFRFDMGGSRYFFAADVIKKQESGELEIALPAAIYEAERRSLPRNPIGSGLGSVLVKDGASTWEGRLLDSSYDGASIALDESSRVDVGSKITLSYRDAAGAPDGTFGLVRNSSVAGGWKRLGLSVSAVPYGPKIGAETRERILESSLTERAQRELRFYGSALGAATSRLTRALGVDAGAGEVEVVRYPNNVGREIVAIADRVGAGRGGLAVVIAPAWGRTKETMLPLAAVLTETLAAAGRQAAVVRFDGTNRRGESWVSPEFRSQGNEYLGFRFSQAVDDIHSTVRFLVEDERFEARDVILVSASLASIEARRAVATDPLNVIRGWVSLVGMVDLHSGLRAASGGVDFAYGLEQGVEFGRHELAGVLADMDLTGRDVLMHHLGLFEDARRDMASIRVPVSWIHGRHDGWIDLERAQELMSSGDTAGRRLIEVPTGHQLRSSRQALETFQLVAEEVGRMAFGHRVAPVVPRGRLLAAKQAAERARRPSGATNLQEFWQRYVLGRDGRLGIEILAATRAYRELMSRQIELLAPQPGEVIVDLGAGAGDFSVALAGREGAGSIRVVAIDFLTDALRRGQARVQGKSLICRPVAADLDGGGIPLASSSVDSIIASLLVSYVSRPDRLLSEAARILRPGGRLVISSPRRDADLSKIYVDGIRELDPATVRDRFGEDAEREFGALQRDLLNQGARLLALEDEGWFRFWDREELADLVSRAGFQQVTSSWSFGDPPQVSLVSAARE